MFLSDIGLKNKTIKEKWSIDLFGDVNLDICTKVHMTFQFKPLFRHNIFQSEKLKIFLELLTHKTFEVLKSKNCVHGPQCNKTKWLPC